MIDRERVKQALILLEEIHTGNMTPMAEESWVKAIAYLQESLTEREHVTDGQPCWCGPEVTEVDPVTGASVVVHKDAIDWEAVAADQALTIAFLRTELEGIEHRPIYVAEVTMPDPEDSPGYTDK